MATEETKSLLEKNLKRLNASRTQAYQSDMNLASQAYSSGNIGRVNELVERNLPLPGEPDQRGFEWYHWWQAGHLSEKEWELWNMLNDSPEKLWPKRVHGAGPERCGAFSPDGRRLASIGEEHKLGIWNPLEGGC